MSDLENLKQENETLKKQMSAHGQMMANTMAQMEALQGELADARTISMQLRLNAIGDHRKCIALQTELDSLKSELNKLKELQSEENKN